MSRLGLHRRVPIDEPWIELLAKILHAAPRLSDAACKAAPKIFDGETEFDRLHAAEICRRCPELTPCARWVTVTPPSRLRGLGVLAGAYYGTSGTLIDPKRAHIGPKAQAS